MGNLSKYTKKEYLNHMILMGLIQHMLDKALRLNTIRTEQVVLISLTNSISLIISKIKEVLHIIIIKTKELHHIRNLGLTKRKVLHKIKNTIILILNIPKTVTFHVLRTVNKDIILKSKSIVPKTTHQKEIMKLLTVQQELL